MGLEVNLAALDGRRERVKLTSQLSRGVGSGTQEGRPRRSTTRTGRVGAFLTAEGRFHVRERFSIFRSRAKLGCLRDLGIRRVIAKLIDEHLSHEIGQLVSVKGVVSLHIVPSGRCVHKGRESVEDLKPASLHNLASHLIRH